MPEAAEISELYVFLFSNLWFEKPLAKVCLFFSPCPRATPKISTPAVGTGTWSSFLALRCPSCLR